MNTQKQLNGNTDLQLRGRWDEIKGRVKAVFGELTDDDLLYVEGKEEELLGKLQQKTGRKREALIRWINSL